MTPDRLAALRELLAKATPLPWPTVKGESATLHTPADSALIVAAVNALPELLDTLARLGERGEQLEGALIDARRTIAEMVAALTAPVEHHLSKRIEAPVSPVEPPT